MANQKIIQVADSLHGSVQISFLEKQIISTQAFNRLHNILQNSTVYLTYPSNQTKRFVHSLGTMHLGGLIFYSSLLNASEEVRDRFLDGINDEIGKLGHDKDFIRTLRLSLGDNFVDLIKNYKKMKVIYDSDPIYQLNTPKVIKDEHLFCYIVIYQAIRLAALLHDVGHPPFSHISENALKEVWDNLKNVPDDNLNERKVYFKTSVRGFFDDNAHLHEEIGYRIAERLTESVICNGPVNREEAETQLFYWLVSKFVTYIFNEENSLFEDIHRIIDGSIDCDRLDYVTRDLENSGFNQGRIEYDRLIRSMRLIYMNDRFLFCPDSRTLSTVEDFFNRRWLLYKYVIYHHRVIKTDYLLEKAIVGLANNYLESPENESEYRGGVLPLNISGLWKAVKEVYSNAEYFNALIQWDDSWLISLLRHRYFETYQEKDNNFISSCLEELLSNRKNYRSLVKRMDDFGEIDRSAANNFRLDDLRKLHNALGNNWNYVFHRLHKFKKFYDKGRSETSFDGFFLHGMKELLDALGKDQPYFDLSVKAALNDVKKKYNIDNCIVVSKKLKTGLERMPYLHRNGNPVLLTKVSKIHAVLRQNQMAFPPFFVYIPEKTQVNETDFLSDIGKQVAIKLTSLIEGFIK